MTLKRLAYVVASIFFVLFAMSVFFLGNQRLASADVTPQSVFCLLNEAGEPVDIFDNGCTENDGSVIPDVCPEDGLQMVGPCQGEEGGGNDGIPMNQCMDGTDNDNDGLTDYPADPDCVNNGDNNEGTEGGSEEPSEEPVDACPNEETDPGVQESGPCNSEDVCTADEGIQVETPCPSDDTDTGGGDESGDEDTDSGSGGGGGGGVLGGGSGGQVLGVATVPGGIACDKYMVSFIKPGAANDSEQVSRMQALLKVFEGAPVEINGEYDASSIAAVHAFQSKYSSEILAPWGISESTGYVYITTRKKMNEIYCDSGLSIPLSEDEQAVIEEAKSVPHVVEIAPVQKETPRVDISDEPDESDESADESPVSAPGSGLMNFFRRLFDRFR